jgi:D-sedoheptulose 7-phosphate isomerase
MDPVSDYINDLQQALLRLPQETIHQAIDVLHEARLNDRQVFILGNGGSASTASHFACDLAKNTRVPGWPSFRVLPFTDNMALMTAYANDEGYENVFSQQLACFVRAADIVIGISTSGNSPNVLNAVKLANKAGATTIGMTGFDGGQLAGLVDIDLHVQSNRIEQVEDIHLMFEHVITFALRDRLVRQYTVREPAFSLDGKVAKR